MQVVSEAPITFVPVVVLDIIYAKLSHNRCHLEENAQRTLDFVSALEAYVSSQTGICGFDRYHSFQERPRLIFDFRGLRACNPYKYKGQISTSSIHTPLADKRIRIQCKRPLNNMSVFVINGNSTLPTIGYLHQ